MLMPKRIKFRKQHRGRLKGFATRGIDPWIRLFRMDGSHVASLPVPDQFLLGPVNQLAPFPVETEYPTEIAGVKLFNYLDWMKSCYYITITSHPAISVPAGFTPGGLPVGLQIVGRYRDDFGVLQLAHAFESETQVWKRRPPLAG